MVGTDTSKSSNMSKLPFMFEYAEDRNGCGERLAGRETDVLTNDQYSDTD